MITIEWAMDLIFNIATLVIAAVGVWVAAKQLTRSADALQASATANELGAKALQSSAKSNELEKLMAVLQLETMMADARLRIMEAFRQFQISRQSGSSTAEQDKHDEQYRRALVQQYLNLLDRFCSCVRRGIVAEETYRRDYRDLIRGAINENSEFFSEATDFRHIKHVHAAWADERSAVDMSWESTPAIAGASKPKALAQGSG